MNAINIDMSSMDDESLSNWLTTRLSDPEQVLDELLDKTQASRSHWITKSYEEEFIWDRAGWSVHQVPSATKQLEHERFLAEQTDETLLRAIQLVCSACVARKEPCCAFHGSTVYD